MKNYITNLKLTRLTKSEEKMVLGGRLSAGNGRDNRISAGSGRDNNN